MTLKKPKKRLVIALFMALLSFSSCGSAVTDSSGAVPFEEQKDASPQPQIRQIGSEGGTEMQTSGANGLYELIGVYPNSYNIFSPIMRHVSKFTCVRGLNVRITMNLAPLLLIARPAIFQGYYMQMIRFT